MLKRLACLAAALALLACAAPAARAENQNLLLMDEYDQTAAFAAVCGVGETLYVHDGYHSAALRRYTLGEDGLADFATLDVLRTPDGEEAWIARLFTDGECLYGLSDMTGDVWLLVDAEGRFAPEHRLRLDFSALREDEEMTILGAACTKDALCLCGSMQMSDSGDTLQAWSLDTGEPLQTVEDVLFVAPYDDTRALILTQDDGEEPTAHLLTFDPQTGVMEPLASVDLPIVTGALYDGASGSLYVLAAGEVYAVEGEAPVLCAYLPWMLGGGISAGMLGRGCLYVADEWRGIAVRELNRDAARQGALVVMNAPWAMQHNAFLREHPDVSVTVTDDALYTWEELTNQLFMQTAGFDLLGVDLQNIPFEKLARKGYLARITDPALLAVADTMEPSVIDACRVDGDLYAMPVSYEDFPLSYDSVMAEEMGLDKLPSSFMELLDFIEAWPGAYAEAWPEYAPMIDDSLDVTLYQMMYQHYVATLQQENQPLRFDTPLFRKLIARLGEIDFDALESALELDTEARWDKQALFNTNMATDFDDPDSSCKRLILSLDADTEPVFPTTLRVMTVNASSARLGEAMQYLLTMAQNYAPAAEGVQFFPSHTQSVERPNWDEDLAATEGKLAQCKADLPGAENAAELREEIERLEWYIGVIHSERYLMTDQMIAAYRANVTPYLVFARYRPVDEDCLTLLWRYLGGAMDAERLIAELDNRVRLATLEE